MGLPNSFMVVALKHIQANFDNDLNGEPTFKWLKQKIKEYTEDPTRVCTDMV